MRIDAERMPCCPLCESPIEQWEAARVMISGGLKGLVHLDCAAEIEDPDPDEDDDG